MDLSSAAALLGVLVAAVTTFLSWNFGRAPLRQLETISGILKDLPEGSDARAHLIFLQDDLARRVNSSYRAPFHAADVISTWFLRLCGGLLVGTSYVWAAGLVGRLLPRADADERWANAPTWILYGVIGGVFIGLAAFQQWARARKRQAWIDEHQATDTRRRSF